MIQIYIRKLKYSSIKFGDKPGSFPSWLHSCIFKYQIMNPLQIVISRDAVDDIVK